jgi:hypothetical protein
VGPYRLIFTVNPKTATVAIPAILIRSEKTYRWAIAHPLAESGREGWGRKRVALIERENPTWDDLAEDWGKPIEPLTHHCRSESRSLASLVMTILTPEI